MRSSSAGHASSPVSFNMSWSASGVMSRLFTALLALGAPVQSFASGSFALSWSVKMVTVLAINAADLRQNAMRLLRFRWRAICRFLISMNVMPERFLQNWGRVT